MMNPLAYIYYTTNLASVAERCAKELLSGKFDSAYDSYFEYGDMYSFMIGYLRTHDHRNGEIIKDAMEEAGMFNYFPFIEGDDKFHEIVSLFLDDPEAKEAMISIIKNATLTNPTYSKTLEKVTHYSGNEKLVKAGFITENEKYIVLDMPTGMLKNVRWYHACTVSSLDDMLQILKIMSGSENAKDYEITIGKEEENSSWLVAVVRVTKAVKGEIQTATTTYRFIPLKWAEQALKDSYNRQVFNQLHIPTEM